MNQQNRILHIFARDRNSQPKFNGLPLFGWFFYKHFHPHGECMKHDKYCLVATENLIIYCSTEIRFIHWNLIIGCFRIRVV